MDMFQSPTVEQSVYALLAGMQQIDYDIMHLKDRFAYIEWRQNTLTSAYERISDEWEQQRVVYEQYLLQTKAFIAELEQRIAECERYRSIVGAHILELREQVPGEPEP